MSKSRDLVTDTLVMHDVVSTDSVDSIVSCFCSILLRLRGGAGDKETAPPPAADTHPAATSTSLQYQRPPQDGHADGRSSSIPNGFEAEGAED